MRLQADIGHRIRATTLALAMAASAACLAENSAATQQDTIGALESALHGGASVEAMTMLLSRVDDGLLQQWMSQEARHTADCDAPDWSVALQSSLAAVEPERTGPLLAAILRSAVPEMYRCIIRQAHAELGFTGREGYALLAEALRSAGILDPQGGAVDDALIDEILDTVLAPGARPYSGGDPPFLNPLEQEPAASSS